MTSITQLHVYPVKGLKGISLQQARTCSTGLAYDRHWVVVRDKDGVFESQRKDPKMALIKTDLPEAAFVDLPGQSEGFLTLSAPEHGEFKIPLRPESNLQRRPASVWDWNGEALDEGDQAAEYLSEFMGHKVRLLRYAGDPSKATPDTEVTRRQLDRNWAPDGTETAFADAMPYMIANEASLEELNSRLTDALPMNRFRPNIVVNGQQAWEEDQWKELRLGDLEFNVNTPNGRCKVTTINQATAEVSKKMEPLKTLGKYRSGKLLNWTAENSWKGLVFFGMYMLVKGQGVLKVGDNLEVLETRSGPPEMITA